MPYRYDPNPSGGLRNGDLLGRDLAGAPCAILLLIVCQPFLYLGRILALVEFRSGQRVARRNQMGSSMAVHDVRLLIQTGDRVQQEVDSYVRLTVATNASARPC